MSKSVVVIASGETERRSLPHLLEHLQKEDIFISEVRIPNRNKDLDVGMAERVIKAAWYSPTGGVIPDKFVVLVDTDGSPPEEVLHPFRNQLRSRLPDAITASLQFAYAQWHLEAWYFADDAGIREVLGRDSGNIDSSQPDAIQNPKLHLKNLLGDRVYTSVISEEIARRVNVETIAQCSESFRGFLDSVRNGNAPQGAQH
ncbi:MAG: hypothetical protein BZY87_10700 [SAR202 cluster bacterium Io17-Chloro-G6]|nr:MAG: hypothetical protein BZY87_10700 [SAR202 cluster bacterium Io17-Chloro-G6]